MGKSGKAGQGPRAAAPAAASGGATKQTNAPTTRKYRGVCWNKKNKRWQSSINVYQKYVYLGSFRIEEDAARCYDRAALKTKGLPCKLNFPASDYFDDQANLLPDENMDRVLADAQAAAAKRVLDSLDDEAGSLGGGDSAQGHVGLAIAVLKQHLAQQDGSATAAVAAAAAAEARPDPLEAGLAAFAAAVEAAGSDDVRHAASAQHMPLASAAAASQVAEPGSGGGELVDDIDAGLLGPLQAFDSGAALQQLWALQQQQQGGGQELAEPDDVYMSSMVQQLEAQVLRLQQQQQQQQQVQGAHPGSAQLPAPLQPQAALHRHTSLQPAESEPSGSSRPMLQRQQPHPAAAAAADDLSVPSLQDMLHHEAQRNAAASSAQQQLRQDLQAMASWLLASTSGDAASPAASNHTGVPATAAPAASPAPPAAAAIAAAAAAAGMPDSTPVFEAAYQATMCDSLAGVHSICSLIASGAVVCSDGLMRCIDLNFMLQQLPPQSRLHHVITHANGLAGVVYQRPCNALRSGLLWGAAMWDGETLHHGSLYSSRTDAVRVCCFVLNVVAHSSRQAEAGEAA